MLHWLSARHMMLVAMAFLAVATGILGSGILNPGKAEAYENNAVYFFWDVTCNEWGEPTAVVDGSQQISHIHPSDTTPEVPVLAGGLSAVVCTGSAAVTLYDAYYFNYVNCITLPGGTNGQAITHYLQNRRKLEFWQICFVDLGVGLVGSVVGTLVQPGVGTAGGFVAGSIAGTIIASGVDGSWNDQAKSLRVGLRPFQNDAISSFKVSNAYQSDTVRLYKDANGKGTMERFITGDRELYRNKIGNDTVSSIWVPYGMQVVLYNDSNYNKYNPYAGTQVLSYTGGIQNVSVEMNDKTSSLLIVGTNNNRGVVMHGGAAMTEVAYTFFSSKSTTPFTDINGLSCPDNTVSSIIIVGACGLTIYRDINYGVEIGTYTTLDG